MKLPGTLLTAAPIGWQLCRREQQLTPHLTVRVLIETLGGWVLAMRCYRCGEVSTHVMDQLPDGMRVYAVRVVGEAGPDPLGTPLPGFEEEFLTIGSSRQDAFERSLFGREVKAAGQLVRTYLDGVEHFDERY